MIIDKSKYNFYYKDLSSKYIERIELYYMVLGFY